MDRRFALAVKYHDAGLGDQAWEVLQDALAEPDAPEVMVRFATALRLKAGAYEDALALSERLLALEVTAQGWQLKGEALLGIGRNDQAAFAFQQSLTHDPTRPEAYLALGEAYRKTSAFAAAETAMRAALALRADAQGWNNLGNLLADLNRPHDAIDALSHALAADPRFALAYNNLGAVYGSQGFYATAAGFYRQALAIDPAITAAEINLGVALLEQGAVMDALKVFDAALTRAPGNRDLADNRLYARIFVEADPRVILAEHRRWGEAYAAPARQSAAAGPRLRVGYVSPDFRRHSVAFFTAPLIAAHGPDAVEVFCYSDTLVPDAVTAQFKTHAHHWRDIHGQSDEAVRAKIHDDRIDVLVDLAGHTQGNRLGVFALRAAPVQITAIGYPATTGLAAMDTRLCDAVTDPAHTFVSEALSRLPRLHCYAPPPAPAVGPLPAKGAGTVTFGSFNKLAKISDATVDLWSKLLLAVPAARLQLKSKAFAEDTTVARTLARFAARGIAPGRIDCAGWLAGDADHLGQYGHIDIALDTFPYNGTTTTCEALWMGVPVLTMMGEGHASRVSASILASVGLNEWTARSPEDFVARGLAFAADLTKLAALRAALRDRLAASPLCDAPSYARAVEAAYRALVTRIRPAVADS